MQIADLFSILFVEKEQIRTSDWSVVVAIVWLLIGISFCGYLWWIFRRNLQHLESIEYAIIPIYRILIISTFRYLVSLVDFLIWLATDGEYSLNGFYESVLWLLMLLQFLIIITNEDLVQISRNRISNYETVIRGLKVFFTIGAVIITTINFAFESLIIESVLLLGLFLAGYQIYRIIKIQVVYVSSIINKIRLEYLRDIWTYFLIYFLSVVVGYGLMGLLFPDGNIDGLYFFFVAIFLNLSPIMISVSAYRSVFIPETRRIKHGIGNPKNFQR